MNEKVNDITKEIMDITKNGRIRAAAYLWGWTFEEMKCLWEDLEKLPPEILGRLAEDIAEDIDDD